MTEAPETAADDQTEVESQQDDPAGNREAAKYRTRAREAELAKSTLQARVEALTRREVDRLTSDKLAQTRDLFDIGGIHLDDLLDSEGDVDPELVDQAVADLLTARPGLGKVTPATPDYGAGNRGSHSPSKGTGWAAVVGPNRAR